MSSYVLQIRYVSGQTERRLFNMPVAKIGREAGDLCLHDREVSTRHAKLLFDGKGLFYFDLGSTHGSFDQDNHRILMPKKLKEGDIVRIGGCEIGIEKINPTTVDIVEPADNFSDEIDTLLQSPAFSDVNLREGSYSGAWAPMAVEQETNHQSQNVINDSSKAHHVSLKESIVPPVPQYLFTSSGPWLERISAEVEDTWRLLIRHVGQVFYTWVLLLVAAAFLRALTGWIPMLGTFVDIMSVVVLIAIGPFAILALGYVLLYARMERPIRAMQAWELAFRQPAAVWVTIVVVLLVTGMASLFFLIPGIMVGVFIFPVLLLEDSRYLNVVRRSMDLFRQSPGRFLSFVLIGVGLPVVAVLSLLFVFIETLGTTNDYAASVLGDFAISMIGGIAFAFLVAWSFSSYLRLRMKFDGEVAILSIGERMQKMISRKIEGGGGSKLSLAQTRADIQIAPG